MSLVSWLNRPGLVSWVWKPSYELVYYLVRIAGAFLLGTIWRVRRVGPPIHEPEGGVVFCANHASYLDPAFVQMVIHRRLTFVMTDTFYRNPWGRWFFKLCGAIPVGSGRKAREGLRRAMAHVQRGYAAAVFPEGKLTADGQLNRAQRGIGAIARRTGAPIVPVGVAGSRHAWGKGSKLPGRARVRVAFGRPLYWSADPSLGRRANEQAFADELMQRIADTKDYIHAAAPDSRDIPVMRARLQDA